MSLGDEQTDSAGPAGQRPAGALEKALAIGVRDRLTVGESVGLYTVTESGDRRLRLAFGSGVAAFLVLLGAAFLLLDIWLFTTGTIRWMRSLPSVWKGALFGLPLCGLLAVVMLGRRFEFQGPSGDGGAVVRRRWLWLFGPEIDVVGVVAVAVRLRPGYGTGAADRIRVCLVDAGAGELLEAADEASDGTDVGAVLTLALQVGHVLGKPVRVEGEPKEMTDRAKDALRQLREKARAH
jgi:hypothetical protein